MSGPNEPGSGGQYDVVIVGGGITGMCLSWFLAESGLSVACLDHGRDSGSTANAGSMHVQMQSRLIRLFPDRLEDFKRTLWLYPLAVEFWQQLAADLEDDVELVINGGLMVAEDAEQLESLGRKCAIENSHGVNTRILDRGELQRIAPYLSDRLHGACYCEHEGKVNPLKANAAIEHRALSAGAAIHREVAVLGIEQGKPGFDVHTNKGNYQSERVVLAAGSGSGELAGGLGIDLPTRAEPLHMNVTDAAEPLIEHLVQHASRPITLKQLYSGHVVVGGGWPAAEGDGEAPPGVLSDSVQGNLELACEIVPRVASLRLLRTWAGVNPLVDLVSVLGEAPSVPGLFVAVPGDAGYTLGPICARLLADRMLDRPVSQPIDQFRPERF
ncbi:MAG: FAD-binding oxidoreductase [Woeseiaceae bacterium]|nr:FAD-binding oxidoreductase [Woeseiaceae bacterium]